MTETNSKDDGSMTRRGMDVRQSGAPKPEQGYDGPEQRLGPGEDLFGKNEHPRDDRP